MSRQRRDVVDLVMPLAPATQSAYAALADWLLQRRRAGLRVLGICGGQGSGKSTLAAFLHEHLALQLGLSVATVSLDDFYLGRADRAQLAARVHPLLATRGVPGTHDAARGIDCLRQLRDGEASVLPRFDKALDDRPGTAHERRIEHADLVLFEGWCVGTPPQVEAELAEPVNELERREDADGRWRGYVNTQLAGPYVEWFALADALAYLQVPDWDAVRRWRGQQERETAAGHGGRSALLDDAARERFLMHYQRLTQHAARVLPAKADVVLRLDAAHAVAATAYR